MTESHEVIKSLIAWLFMLSRAKGSEEEPLYYREIDKMCQQIHDEIKNNGLIK